MNTLIVKCFNPETAKVIKTAIDPDNVPLPNHIQIKTKLRSSYYQVMITTQNNLASLLTTTEEILQALALIQNLLVQSRLK